MTRFQKELSGSLGEYWKQNAEKELLKVQEDFNNRKITVDENGILRNCIGRVATSEVIEKAKYIGIEFDEEATQIARDKEVEEQLKSYVENKNDENIDELRAAFAPGTTVVNVLTGEKIYL